MVSYFWPQTELPRIIDDDQCKGIGKLPWLNSEYYIFGSQYSLQGYFKP